MATEVVVKESLSSEMISVGAELTRLLDAEGFPVTASFWFYLSETNTWRLVIAWIIPGARERPRRSRRPPTREKVDWTKNPFRESETKKHVGRPGESAVAWRRLFLFGLGVVVISWVVWAVS